MIFVFTLWTVRGLAPQPETFWFAVTIFVVGVLFSVAIYGSKK